jgi:diguanylate cyclase (GGDEF)-like protein/PAS domain S-box-containing protein
MERDRGKAVMEWVLAAVLVAVSVWFSKTYTKDASRLATMWLANGLVVGLLLCTTTRRWPPLLLAGFLGNLIGAAAANDPARSIAISGSFNLLEVLVAAWPLRHARDAQALAGIADLTRPKWFAKFFVAAVLVAPLVSGIAVAGFSFLRTGLFASERLEIWVIAHAIGMGIMVPVTLAFRSSELRVLFDRRRIPEKLLVFALLVGVTCIVFWQSHYPLLFLMFPPLLLVAMRAGFAATSGAILLVTVAAVGFSNAGHGPLALIGGGAKERYLVLQLFIGVQILTLFPIVLMMAERRRARRVSRANELRYRMLADNSSDVILLTDADSRRVYVSPAVTEMLGWTPEEFLRLSFRDLVHPDDLEAVTAKIHPPDPTWTKLMLVYRARRRDGAVIWIEAQVAKFKDKHVAELAGLGAHGLDRGRFNHGKDGVEGRVVTLRDITRRRLAEQQLEAANLQLASLVWKDSLTGLANRRRFDEYLGQEWDRAVRSRSPLALIILDVDHFKVYNDCYGHQQGDHCLIAVSDAIASGLHRPSDLAARYGGEEFAVVMPDTTLAGAQQVAERIRRNLLGLRIAHAGSALGVVTVSVGVADCIPHSSQSEDELVQAADAAMYRSKEGGRNRTTTALLEPPPMALSVVK